MSSNKKQKTEVLPISNFFKPASKISVIEKTLEAHDSHFKKPHPTSVDFIKDCPLFTSCQPGFKYDISFVVGRNHDLSDGAKYQILTCRDYLPRNCKFPPSHLKSGRHCTPHILDSFDFLRYSPRDDGVYCVVCVLFSNFTGKKKFISEPERDWSNIYKTATKHTKPPEVQLNKTQHPLCAPNL